MPTRKPFPVTTFEVALTLARGLYSLGAEGPIKRLTLLNELGRRPSSSTTRDLITHSSAYGLTKGGHSAPNIELTEAGRVAVDDDNVELQRRKHFDLAINGVDPFRKVFEKYEDKAVPSAAALKDILEQLGVDPGDTGKAMRTLRANLMFVGAIADVSGKEHIVMPSFESKGRVGNDTNGPPEELSQTGRRDPLSSAVEPERQIVGNRPQLHIDVQVHIDSSATTEQIDQIFRSMAEHLYGNGEYG